jgi:methylglutaconyl-CoA hydratase
MKAEFNTLKCELKGKIAVVTLSAPPLNLLSAQMLRDLRDVMGELETQDDLRCVIFTGEGKKAFCAGADVGEYSDPTIDQLDESDVWSRGILTRLSNFPCPTIAAINGYALGGGLELALACDIRIASDNAKMGLVETKIGMIAGWGGSQRLPRIIGVAQAKRLMFAAEKITAENALSIGLVTEVFTQEQLLDKAIDLANKISYNSPVSNRMTKQAVNFYMNQNIMEGLELERKCDRATYMSEDCKEGSLAFEEKRDPVYKNR